MGAQHDLPESTRRFDHPVLELYCAERREGKTDEERGPTHCMQRGGERGADALHTALGDAGGAFLLENPFFSLAEQRTLATLTRRISGVVTSCSVSWISLEYRRKHLPAIVRPERPARWMACERSGKPAGTGIGMGPNPGAPKQSLRPRWPALPPPMLRRRCSDRAWTLEMGTVARTSTPVFGLNCFCLQ